jgi:ketosteroid isomerase-like protein
MKTYSGFWLIAVFIFLGCSEKVTQVFPDVDPMETYRQEIIEVEKAFETMVGTKGMEAAFLHFAADNAVLERNEKPIIGKNAIASYFKNMSIKDIKIVWTPDFVDVSSSGDMAYTYGSYIFTGKDLYGQDVHSQGTFHTVWKRQSDGSWKYVYD